jgi:hypothetical protein
MSHAEILAVSDRTHVQNQPDHKEGAWSKLAADVYSQTASTVAGAGRELALVGQGVVWGGIKEGYDAFTKNTKQTCLNLAETVGVGAAISIAAKAGPMPLKLLASGAGLFFGYQMTDWMKNDVFNGDRWRRIGGAVSDTWSSNANMDRNIATMQKDAGLLAFDSALMFGGGALGGWAGNRGLQIAPHVGRAGMRVVERFAPRLTGATSLEALNLATDVRRITSEDPFAKADQIKKAKKTEVSANSLQGIQNALREAQMRDLASKDQITRDLTDVKMPELTKQNANLKQAIDGLNGQLKAKNSELTAVQTLENETKTLRSADAKVDSLQQIERQLGAKRNELKNIDGQIAEQTKAREDAKKEAAAGAASKTGKPGAETSEVSLEDLKQRARDLKREISEGEAATNRNNPASAINKALEAQTAARSELLKATDSRPARTESLRAEIDNLKGQLEEHNKGRAHLGLQMQALVDAYYGRIDALMKDPTLLQAVEPAAVTKPSAGQQTKARADVTNTASGAQDGTQVSEANKAAAAGDRQDSKVNARTENGANAGTESGARVADSTISAATEHSTGSSSAKVSGDKAQAVKPADALSEPKSLQQAGEAKSESQEAKQLVPEEKARLEAAGRAQVALDNARPVVREARERLQAIEDAKDTRKQARHSLELAAADLAGIESGKRTFVDEAAKQKAIEELKARQLRAQSDIDSAQDTIKRLGSQYFQAMKGIGRYATAVEDYFAREADAKKRQDFAYEAVKNLEALLDELPQSRQGVKPPSDNLGRRGHFGKEFERVTEIREHVANRLEQMDNKHDGRIKKVLDVPAVSDAFDKVTSGAIRNDLKGAITQNLISSQDRIAGGAKPERMADRDWNSIQARIRKLDPQALAADQATLDAVHKEASVVFFDQNGKLIGQIGTDKKFRAKYFDVPAILRGPARGGAGVDRLLGENPVGYAVVAPKVRLSFSGRPELHQIGSNTKGAPVFNKEVVITGGRVPEFATTGTPVNRLFPGDGKSGSAARPRVSTTSDTALESKQAGGESK